MRSVNSVVIERNSEFRAEFATEPHEVGWATEAIFFIESMEAAAGTWRAHTEISADGLTWVRRGETVEFDLQQSGLVYVPETHFGNWLRLRVAPVSADAESYARVLITLVLK